MSQKFKKLPITLAVISTLYGGSTFAADAESTLSNITVFGRGETRQVSEISKEEISANAPGTSPLLALSVLPGVSFSAADSQGNYEWGSRISIRGFSQNQLGFTLDDVPLGDMSYRNYNGLHISRAIASENIGRVEVSQGTGSLGTASSSNLGGTIKFYSLDPSDKRGASFDQTFGSYANSHSYARFDSGLIDGTNTKFAISATNQEGNKWKGPGEQIQRKINFKLVSDLSDNARFSGFINYSDSKQDDYQDLSYNSIKRLGYRLDQTRGWALVNAIAAATDGGDDGNLVAPVGNYTNLQDTFYGGSGLREDWLIGGTLSYAFNDKVDTKTTIYHHSQDGTGTWWLPVAGGWGGPSQAGQNVALRELGFDINRSGILTALNYDAGNHKINTGIWYENNDFTNTKRFFNDGGAADSLNPPTNGWYAQHWNRNFDTDTIQFHLQDTFKATDDLTINAGFKSLYAKTEVQDNDPNSVWGGGPQKLGSNINGSLTASDGFLPQIGAVYKVDKQNEVFADVSQSLAAYRAVALGGATPFNRRVIPANLKPEESTTYEIGWRHNDKNFETSLTAYHIEFNNRLLNPTAGNAIAGNVSEAINVGKVETNGVEGLIVWEPISHVKWINSASYNDSQYKNNVTTADGTFATADKQVVDAPKKLFSTKLAYDDGALHGYLGANATSRRYYTYTNDNSIAGYALWNLGGGYRWKKVGLAEEIDLHFAVTNLFDRKYYAIGDNSFPISDPNGDSYNLLAGTPRTVYVGLGAKF
ncbi:MAG: TonB-dependent receptor [Methylotenera sp.]|nr:TonB-dependent receptor [Methylotenera sp.]